VPLTKNYILTKRRTKNLTETKNILITPHDDFDWSMDKRSANRYTEAQTEQLANLYDGTFKTINNNEIVTGTIVGITKTDVVVNIGFKSDGLVSLNEFRDMPSIKVGEEVDVFVVSKEDKSGQLVLSRKNAKLAKAWERIVAAHGTGEIVHGYINSKTKGGLIVDLFGLETFLPGSQIDVKPVTDYDGYVGKTMEFKVVKINEIIKNAVVSHKALIESDIESQRAVIMSQMEIGQVLEGTIKNITDFGAFIDLGGIDGLLYITDISWGRINHPNEVLEMNQKINVVVLGFDDNKKRISLGLKQLSAHPWEALPTDMTEGQKVKGKIVNIEEYGAFLEIQPGIEGLIHVSEISWANQTINSKEFFKVGEEMEALVVSLDKDQRKMSLSLKQLTLDPWKAIEEKYVVGSKHSGEVKNITAYGVFVELETGIGGMIHISDLSWTKRYQHANEFTKVGNKLDVTILNIDNDNRKLSLGHKQLEEDPWETFESIFPVGSVHEGTIVKKDDKGAVVQLQYGLEGYAHNKHLKKEDGKNAELEETLPFKILEFEKNDKKIILSHTKYVDQIKDDTRKVVEGEVVAEEKRTKDTVKSINEKAKKSTMGDIDALSKLKDSLEKEGK
jgi:small subunit ribosomal protein S1